MEMDEKILDYFVQNSFYYPNPELFETPSLEELQIKKKIFEKLKKITESKKKYEQLLMWFKGVYELIEMMEVNIIMYGKMVYGTENSLASDLDIYVITKIAEKRKTPAISEKWWEVMSNVPSVMHVFYIYADSRCPLNRLEGWRRFGLLNNLIIIPRGIPAWLFNTIDKSREIIKNAPFFRGGIGELITYAAWKILDRKEKEYFSDEKQAEMFFQKRLPAIVVQTDWGMPTPFEINQAARDVFKEKMTEGQLYQLALAAMKRIGIKKERKKELALKFVKELKPRRVLPLPA
ncbi:MAG: hypothetical protein QXF35_02860 [Candidatus Bilamarchaeaceae archaeon]